jgi:type IV pilus assembly protein PilQ
MAATVLTTLGVAGLIPRATTAQVHEGDAAEITLTERGTVRMNVAEVPLSTVLHLLSLEGKRNIVASPNVKGTVTANLYDVSFEEALRAVLVLNDAGYQIVGDFIYVYTNKELADLKALRLGAPISRVYRLNYIGAADAKAFLEPVIGKEGAVAVPPAPAQGLKSEPESAGGNAYADHDFIIVTARPDLHTQVQGILREIDVRPKQVLIEATILRAELAEDNALGVDFTILGGVDMETLNARSIGVETLTLGELPQDRFNDFNSNATTDLTGNIGAGGLRVGIIEDHVAVFIRALEEVTDTTVLANPKVLALNKQKAQVIVGRRDGYFTTTVTETQAIQTVQFLETGTQLIFRPFIGDDGFVRVELHPEDSVGFVSAQGLPTEQTTEVTTNVVVRDGQTILIGGLFREVVTAARTQVPGLGSIPWVGTLFRSEVDSTDREEIIILLTIHVVKDQNEYERLSQEQFENTERLRVAARRGLMWFGRERLAQAQYHRALDCWSAGKVKSALWHVNMALHNQPRMIAAIDLKEKILGERAWDDEGSGGRFFLQTLIARERGYRLPPVGRPAVPDAPPQRTDRKAEPDAKEGIGKQP